MNHALRLMPIYGRVRGRRSSSSCLLLRRCVFVRRQHGLREEEDVAAAGEKTRGVGAPAVPPAWREFPADGTAFREGARVGAMDVTFETGKLAKFAAGAAVVGIGETKVLTTVVADFAGKSGGAEFLPLQVEYREKQYAQGKIPNTFMRREGGPKERELLCGRVVDRAVRPLFPKGFFCETQIIANVLCSDGGQDPDVMAMNAASAALTVSNIPWNGPIGAVRLGRVDGRLVVNPNMAEVEKSDLNMVYACAADATLMIETQAAEISNADYAAALRLAHAEAARLIEPQRRLAARVRNRKMEVAMYRIPASVLERIRRIAGDAIREVMGNPAYGKFERGRALSEVCGGVAEVFRGDGDEAAVAVVDKAFDAVRREIVRGNVLDSGRRVDGRAVDEVRELSCEAGLYPALHGSSLFSRGNTQVLCTVTMGAPDDAQRLDSIVGPDSKRFMVHYSFPPFSVNEVGRLGGLNRREVGHGTLAEKALIALLPPPEEFPFSVRVTSEVLASDGSSSMATVCGGSLALMDAGIPLREHVAGVSVGLVTATDPATGAVTDYRLLTDILGLEDHLGDMDFKIAGTRKGITAVQLDMKLPGIPLPILLEALEPALVGRARILDAMERVLVKSRDDARENRPRRAEMSISRESIGRLIGPHGANIKNIQRLSGAKLSVTDEGMLTIFAKDQASYAQAKALVESCVGREVEVGGVYFATVVAIKDFGAFVELDGGQQGMVHISEISHKKVLQIAEVLVPGQNVKVVCIGRDIRGNLKLSRKAAMTSEEETEKTDGQPESSFPSVSSPSAQGEKTSHSARVVTQCEERIVFDQARNLSPTTQCDSASVTATTISVEKAGKRWTSPTTASSTTEESPTEESPRRSSSGSTKADTERPDSNVTPVTATVTASIGSEAVPKMVRRHGSRGKGRPKTTDGEAGAQKQ